MLEVSVILRTRNEARALPVLVAGLRRQLYTPAPELIVVDSGSTDATCDVARELRVDRLIESPRKPFSFGRSLNLGAVRAGGDLLVAVSAHARPVDDDWLARLVRPFVDPDVGAVYGRQLPKPDAWPPVAFDYLRCYGDARLVHRTPEEAFFSNANAALRRSLWECTPFDEGLPACEDQDWARRIVAQGWMVVYEPEAAVYHSHNEWPPRLYRRRAREALGWRRVTGCETSFRDFLDDWWRSSRSDIARLWSHRRRDGHYRFCRRLWWSLLSPGYRFFWAVSPWYPYV